MKRLINFVLCLFVGVMAWAQLPELTVEQHLEDYDFAVKYIEDNYSGFSFWVNDSTRSDYEETKNRLRGDVERGERPCWDAVAAYTGWFSDFHMTLYVTIDNLTPYSYFHRESINYAELMEVYDPQPVACKVTDKTFLIRYPSCDVYPDQEWIKNSIKQFKKSHCKNLILDVRGNGGGNDNMYYPYLHLLYDHRGGFYKTIEIRNTPQNMEYLKQQGWHQRIQQMATEYPELEYLSYPKSEIFLKKKDKSVKKAALIIDNSVASSAENLVRDISRCSNRTAIYGRDNTSGCNDFGNLSDVQLPNCRLWLNVPISRTVGLPENSIDKNGIAPDVRIPLPLPARLTDNIDEWVIWVAEQLEK